MILTINILTLSENKKVKERSSIIGQAFQYDKLNDRLNPTDG